MNIPETTADAAVGALGYTRLSEYLTHPEAERRLVVTPILDPREQLKPNQAGIDVRLGRVFRVAQPWAFGVAEIVESSGRGSSVEPHFQTVVLGFGQPLIIHPHQFVLGRTLEILRVPSNLLAYVMGRSSWGRRGLIVATAVVVHPGFAGPITLELRNLGEMPLALYPMDRIAQLTFHELRSPGATGGRSQFSSTFVPGLGNVRDTTTRDRLRQLVDAREKQSNGFAMKRDGVDK
jgi:dCTP deaminase